MAARGPAARRMEEHAEQLALARGDVQRQRGGGIKAEIAEWDPCW